jgi:hypothetical protein
MSADGNSVLITGIDVTPYVYVLGPRFQVNNTLNVYGGNVGIGTTNPQSNLYVTGNIYASNAVTATNVFAATETLTGTTGRTTLNVTGNVYVSNAVTATIHYGNVSASNVVVTPATGVTGINVTGNIYASNAVTATNLVASGTLYYNEDLTRRAPHIIPTVANASIIQAWISATCNVVDEQGSFWAPSSRPTFSNIATGPVGSTAYIGSVSLSDGRILFVPYNATTVGLFSPYTNQFLAVTPTNFSGIVAPRFFGGVAVPSGNVVFIPYTSSNIGSYNPTSGFYANVFQHNIKTPAFEGGVLDGQSNVTMVPSTGHSNICAYNGAGVSTFSNMVSTGTLLGFTGAVLLPTGNIMCIPDGTSNIVQYNPTARTYSNSTIGSSGFQGGVLAPNGNVVCIPNTNANVVVVNPFGNPPYAYSNIQVRRTGGGGFGGGVLLPSGNIVCVSNTNSNAGMIDPVALTYSNITPQSGVAQTGSYFGASLTIDGRVIFCPFNSTNVACLTTTTPCVPELRLAPYFNKL